MKQHLQGRPLVMDRACQIYDLLEPWVDEYFYDMPHHVIRPGAVYVLGAFQVYSNLATVRELWQTHGCVVVFCNAHEGSYNIVWHSDRVGMTQDILNRKVLLITGGDMEPAYPNLVVEDLLRRVATHEHNLAAVTQCDQIYQVKAKPYKFLFLNGLARRHRRYLIERLDQLGWLDHSLWSCLDGNLIEVGDIHMIENGQDILQQPRPNRFLPPEYELPAVRERLPTAPQDQFAKYEMFGGAWQDASIHAPAYRDSYFSLVTETVYGYPYSFRTEKIWKPIMMGHPWICAANQHFYRDLRRMGFRTFDTLIDESWDLEAHNQTRMERIVTVVDQLCRSNLDDFLEAARPICEHNRERFHELSLQVQQQLPARFFEFLRPHC